MTTIDATTYIAAHLEEIEAAAAKGDNAARWLLMTRLAYNNVLTIEKTWKIKQNEALIEYLEGMKK